VGLFDRSKKIDAAQQQRAQADAAVAAAYAQSSGAKVGYQGPGVGDLTPEQQQALIAQAMSQPAPTQAEADFRNYGGTVDESTFAPAANGVTWQSYGEVIAQSASVNYDPARLAAIAEASGISGDAWTAAGEEFGARAQANPAFAREMGRIVREGHV
jgi:hypothetical protein